MHVGKKDKQVKQHYYATSSQNYTNEGLQYDDPSIIIICSAIFYHTLVVCYHAHCSILYLASDMCGL